MLFAFDDGLASTYAIRSLFSDRDIVATMYVVSNWVGTPGYCTAAELQELNNLGWAIGNHSQTHPDFTTLSQAQIQAQIANCAAVLDGLGLSRASLHVAYPYTSYNAATLAAMAAAGALSGRTGGGYGQGTFDPDTVVRYQIPSNVISNTITLDGANVLVNAAIGTYGMTVLMFHGIVEAEPGIYEWLASDLESLLDYVLAYGCNVYTISDLF